MSEKISASNRLWDIRKKIIKGAALTDDEKKYLASYLFMAAELEQKGLLTLEATWRLAKNKEIETILERLDLSKLKYLAEQNNAEIEFTRFSDADKKGRGHADEKISAEVELMKKIGSGSQNEAIKVVAKKTGSTIGSVETRHKRYKKKLKKSD